MNNKINEIVNLIDKYDKIAIFHHKLPDGDAISSSYALMEVIKNKYPYKKVIWLANEEYLIERFPYLNLKFSNDIEEIDKTWLTILGDCSDPDRTYLGDEYKKGGAKIIFDHHQNEAKTETDIFWHEPSWPASAIQSFQIAKALQPKWNEELAIFFYYGIMTDTNRFSYSLANPLPLKESAELFEMISDERLGSLYKEMEQRDVKTLRFQGWVLNNFSIDNKVAYIKIKRKDQEKLKLKPDDCARVNIIGNIKGIEAWLFFIQYEDYIRVEFRSLGKPMNKVAAKFGGGGHIKAAGCKLDNMEESDKVIDEVKKII